MNKRILIVNCYFDDARQPVRRRIKALQAMGPAFLAGVFSPDRCDVRLYNEQYSGPLESEKLLSFPDMLVLTGLNTAFDRMRHLTAYARTKNKRVIVVAGGPAIRALPLYSARFFDYCCTGDIEELKTVIEAEFGLDHVSDALRENGWAIPRYDLAYWMKLGGYVESSRNCYFSCKFCSLTAENATYRQYDMDYICSQFKALGRKKRVLFIDNNFGSSNGRFLQERLEFLKQLKDAGYMGNWSAMASADFFSDENLEHAKASGCVALFSGVESFDSRSIENFGKNQNHRLPQIDMIKRCLNAGISFSYGLLLDIARRSVADMKKEIEFILDTHEIPLPSYISVAIPMLNTPFFYECAAGRQLLPHVKLRDLDGTTLTIKPFDSIEKVIQLIRDLRNFSGYRRKTVRHMKNFYHLYKRQIGISKIPFYLNGAAFLCFPNLFTAGPDVFRWNFKKSKRTFIGTTEPLDDAYKPAFRVDACYENFFQPTFLTNADGNINETLMPDMYQHSSLVMKRNN